MCRMQSTLQQSRGSTIEGCSAQWTNVRVLGRAEWDLLQCERICLHDQPSMCSPEDNGCCW